MTIKYSTFKLSPVNFCILITLIISHFTLPSDLGLPFPSTLTCSDNGTLLAGSCVTQMYTSVVVYLKYVLYLGNSKIAWRIDI